MKKKILIVEDEEMLAKVLIEQFNKAGFDVEAAFDGEQALESLKKSLPDLILLDIILPKKDGFEVLKAVKENPDTQDIPVIMISNLGSDEDIKQSIKLGAVDYYVKAQHPIYEITEKVVKFLSVPKSPLKKVKAPKKEAVVPLEAVEEKPIKKPEAEIKKIEEKPIEKIVEKPVEKIKEKPKAVEKPVVIEKKPAEIIAEKPIEKAIEKPFGLAQGEPAEKIIKKPAEIIAAKPVEVKKVVEKPAEVKKELEKPVGKMAEKPKAAEKPFDFAQGKPVEKKIKEEYPQLSKGARKFIRMKKAELNKMNLSPEEYEKEVAKIYQTFSKKS